MTTRRQQQVDWPMPTHKCYNAFRRVMWPFKHLHTLDTALSWALGNTLAKCEDNPMRKSNYSHTYRQTDR